MNFIKNILLILFLLFSFNLAIADTTDSTKEIVEKAKEITKNLENKTEEEEDVPLNDPFAGNEGSNTSMNLDTGEERDEMSLYNVANFKGDQDKTV